MPRLKTLQTLVLDSSDRQCARIWGRENQPLPVFFAEYLPAFFSRTLIFKELHLASPAWLQWKLTGPEASLVIQCRVREIIAFLEYHDSAGLAPEAESFAASIWDGSKHPTRRKFERRIQLAELPAAITVEVDRSLNATIRWGAPDFIRFPCTCDLLRHQLNLIGEGKLAASLEAPATRAVVVEVDPDRHYQTIRGFGGIMSAPAWRQLSPTGKKDWLKLIVENNWLIQREYPTGGELNPAMDNWDSEASALPHYYGDNFPNGESSDFSYNAEIQKLGGEVWFEFWLYPPWVQPHKEGTWAQQCREGEYFRVNPEKFVEAVLAYCRTAVNRTGHPPAIVGIQNEMSPSAEDLALMVPLLRQRLDAEGFEQVAIHMANCSSLEEGFEFLRRVQADPKAWAAIDFLAVNQYDAQELVGNLEQYAAKLKRFRLLGEGRPVLSPEISLPQPRFQGHGYRLAAMMAELFHYNMVEFEATALCYCWTLLDTEQPNYEATRSLYGLAKTDDFTAQPKGRIARTFNAFSRSLPKGTVRIEARSSDPDLLVSAWQLPDLSTRLIAFNRGTDQIALAGLPQPSTVTAIDLYHEYTALEPDAPLTVPPGGFLVLTL